MLNDRSTSGTGDGVVPLPLSEYLLCSSRAAVWASSWLALGVINNRVRRARRVHTQRFGRKSNTFKDTVNYFKEYKLKVTFEYFFVFDASFLERLVRPT